MTNRRYVPALDCLLFRFQVGWGRSICVAFAIFDAITHGLCASACRNDSTFAFLVTFSTFEYSASIGAYSASAAAAGW